jgi:hypothetical protein
LLGVVRRHALAIPADSREGLPMTRRAILLALLALLAAGCNRSAERDAERQRYSLTELLVERYAAEFYPTWARSHPSQECPESLEAIATDVGAPPPVDAWNHPLVMYCGKDVPTGARGFAVRSPGPDGTLGNDDDVKSW